MNSSNENKLNLNRREFVRLSTLATAGSVTAACAPIAYAAKETPAPVAAVSKCPVMGHTSNLSASISNQHWWPNQLNLKVLQQNSPLADPMVKKFNYAEAFKSLDLDARPKDMDTLMPN